MDTPRYEIILYWSADDEAFIAEVPELPSFTDAVKLGEELWSRPDAP